MFSNHSKHAIILGFVIVMMLMVAVVAVGNRQMSEINRSMETIVNEHNVKTGHIITMYNSVRERSLTLLRMVNIEDAFDRDDAFLHINELATEFIVAHTALSGLGFDDEEAEHFSQFGQLIRAAAPLQDAVVEIFIDEKKTEATRLLWDEAIPAQNLVLKQLSSMLDYQQLAARLSLQGANVSYQKSIVSSIILLIGAIIIGLLIAWYVVKHASRAKEALFAQVTLGSIGDGVITTDSSGCINYLNPRAEIMTGYTLEAAKGRAIIDIFNVMEDSADQDSDDDFQAELHDEQAQTVFYKTVLKLANGETIAVDFSATPIIDKTEKQIGTAIVFRNVNQERELRKQLSYQATHDALTGLINRYEFEKRLDKLINSAIDDDAVHALLYMDLDEFKIVNDTCGHTSGDELLRQLSTLLKNRIRGGDIIARLGGDEFGILLKDCNPDSAVKIATEILHSIQDYRFIWDDESFTIGASIGVVKIDCHIRNMANAMGIADAACYSAKDEGRNRIHVVEEDDTVIASMQSEMLWVSRITHALENDSFELHYQPIIPIKKENQNEFAIELLVRMRSEDGELIPPGEFIPAAERYNLMVQLDQWVVAHAFEWLSSHPEITSDLHQCAINLSGQSIGDDKFLFFIKSQFSNYEIDPAKICFEITETAAISNLSDAIRFITELKTLGCFFALDDFGSGLSSFAYLKNLPVDYIKIDGMFVRDIDNNLIDREMVKSIAGIGRVMGKQTIAEFVENDEILEILKEIDVDYAQGYAIAKPKSLESLGAEMGYLQSATGTNT